MCAQHDHDHTYPLFTTTLPPQPSSPRRARAAVGDKCRTWGLSALIDDASLVVSELVSNSVQHADTDIDLTLCARLRGLRLEVSDSSTDLPLQRTSGLLEQGGRGLALVEALSTNHGVLGRRDGKTVWAELDSSNPFSTPQNSGRQPRRDRWRRNPR